MAQIVHIPFSFEYRKRSVQWERASARVTDSSPGADGSLQLCAQIVDGKGTKSINFMLSGFPAAERKALLSALKRASGGAKKEVLSSIELNLFLPTTHVPPVDQELKKHTHPADAWEMRDDFLRMVPGSDDPQTFLNKWGRWHQTRNCPETREMFALQKSVRDALTAAPEGWFATGNAFLPRVPSVSTHFPYFAMVTDACWEAICIATTIDLLKQEEFKVCARKDCELPFKIVSKHAKQYCSQKCAHLVSVRRNRKSKAPKPRKGALA